MSEDGAAVPRNTAPQLPWGDGQAERADRFLIAAIALSSLYLLAWIPLTPVLVANHPVLLELFKGSLSGMVTMGALAPIGDAALLVAALATIPCLMTFDCFYWGSGRRLGRKAADTLDGRLPEAPLGTGRLDK